PGGPIRKSAYEILPAQKLRQSSPHAARAEREVTRSIRLSAGPRPLTKPSFGCPLYSRGRSRPPRQSTAPISVPIPRHPNEVGAIITHDQLWPSVGDASVCDHKFFLGYCRSDQAVCRKPEAVLSFAGWPSLRPL